jgi:hypothetical protein
MEAALEKALTKKSFNIFEFAQQFV